MSVVSEREIVADPAKVEFYDAFGTAYICLEDGERFLLNQATNIKPQDVHVICERARQSGQNLYVRFSTQARGFIPQIHAIGEVALAAGASIPLPNTTPIGPERTGHVIVITPSLETAQVQEDNTGRRFSMARNFCDAALFDQLIGDTTVDPQGQSVAGRGTRIKFRDNGHNVIAAFRIPSP